MMIGLFITPLPAPPGPAGDREQPRDDHIRTGVHVVLALYLMPAILTVLVFGGFLVLLEGLARLIEAHAPLGRGVTPGGNPRGD
jgi:hypothetical protein